MAGSLPRRALRRCVKQIVAANPWLLGTLQKDKGGVKLVHPLEVTEEALGRFMVVDTATKLSSASEYAVVASTLAKSGGQLPKATSRFNRSDLVSRLTLAKDSAGGFALVL